MVLKDFIANWSETLWKHLKPYHIIKSVKDNYRLLVDRFGVLDYCNEKKPHGSIGGVLTPIEIPCSNILAGSSIAGLYQYPDGYEFAVIDLPEDIVAISANPSSKDVLLIGVDFIVEKSILFFNKDPREYLTSGISGTGEVFYGVASRTNCYKQLHSDLVDRNVGCSDNKSIAVLQTSSRESALTGGVSLDRMTLPSQGVSEYAEATGNYCWTEGDYVVYLDDNGTVRKSKKSVDRLLVGSNGEYSWLINLNGVSRLLGPLRERFPELDDGSISFSLALSTLRRNGYVSIEASNTIPAEASRLIDEYTPAAGGITHFQTLNAYCGDGIPALSDSSDEADCVYLVYCDPSSILPQLPVFPGITISDVVDSMCKLNGGAAKSVQKLDEYFIVDNSAYIGKPMRSGDRLIGILVCSGGHTTDTCSILKYVPVTNLKISIGCCIAVAIQ